MFYKVCYDIKVIVLIANAMFAFFKKPLEVKMYIIGKIYYHSLVNL